MTPLLLVAGGVVVLGASLLGGVTGFGFSLVCTPVLLLLGMELTDVVVVNLAIGLLTRLATIARLHRSVHRRRAADLVAGSVPGLLIGYLVRDVVGGDALKVTAGAVAVVVAGYLLLRPADPVAAGSARAPRLAAGTAGLLGGFLGITTSLNGPPPVVLLARQQVAPRQFVADLAVYFIVCNGLALALIGLAGDVEVGRIGVLLACWLPGGLLGNALGNSWAARVPQGPFRLLTLGLVVLTGLATVVTALVG
ncbi:sulfite exporter TauE/SafE family protein [Modestobacter altitudinis]|uniref:sulfite exporter TauE/SafE family protein n=1 Tax=Modestobacter altitudinis TaxID=2213158 RepID=UPI001487431A|nr:sulfite exporter TauE/SafE family protein [Modestobacter altitudinis]